jgi:NADH dehydrogenase
VTSYFGIKGLDAYSYGIKSAPEIDRFQHHLHDLLNQDQHLDRNYVIVGAGPTGVELSAALASYLKFVSKRHDIKKAKISIKLIEAAPRVLPRMQESSSRAITRRLRNLGVTVMTGQKVESQDDDSIMVNGKDIPSHTVVWTSGVSNHPFFANHSTHFPLAPNGKVVVDDHLMVDSHTYVIGDNAATPYAGLAQTAVYDARYVAQDIKRAAHHEPRHAYKPFMPPVVIPVGTRWAAFEWRKLRFGGFLGYLIRRAADVIGYGELLHPRYALRAWRSEEWLDENCTRCM